jgi:hypothetical protein
MQAQIATLDRSYSVPMERIAPTPMPLAGLLKLHWPVDGQISKAAEKLLRGSPYLGLLSVKADAHRGILVLCGNVTSYFHKQLAQEMVRNVDDVRGVKNCVQVIDEAKIS